MGIIMLELTPEQKEKAELMLAVSLFIQGSGSEKLMIELTKEAGVDPGLRKCFKKHFAMIETIELSQLVTEVLQEGIAPGVRQFLLESMEQKLPGIRKSFV